MFYKYIKKLNTFYISQKTKYTISLLTKYNSLILKTPIYYHIFFRQSTRFFFLFILRDSTKPLYLHRFWENSLVAQLVRAADC